MKSRALRHLALAALFAALLALVWWGWQQGGLAILQLGTMLC